LRPTLLKAHAGGRSNVLVIDEAQNLAPEVLEQLRLLTNLETNERKLLQIILIGQPELRAMLAQPQLEQLAQRVIARYHLGALGDATETTRYVRHRMEACGLKGPLYRTDEPKNETVAPVDDPSDASKKKPGESSIQPPAIDPDRPAVPPER
jgi:type II secretory pathway predicted ATPase ExeA